MNAVTSRSAASDDVETRCPAASAVERPESSSLVELAHQAGASVRPWAFQRLMMRVLAPATETARLKPTRPPQDGFYPVPSRIRTAQTQATRDRSIEAISSAVRIASAGGASEPASVRWFAPAKASRRATEDSPPGEVASGPGTTVPRSRERMRRPNAHPVLRRESFDALLVARSASRFRCCPPV